MLGRQVLESNLSCPELFRGRPLGILLQALRERRKRDDCLGGHAGLHPVVAPEQSSKLRNVLDRPHVNYSLDVLTCRLSPFAATKLAQEFHCHLQSLRLLDAETASRYDAGVEQRSHRDQMVDDVARRARKLLAKKLAVGLVVVLRRRLDTPHSLLRVGVNHDVRHVHLGHFSALCIVWFCLHHDSGCH